jgi:predicted nuclease of predicted toxin-antitoxin system
LKPGRPTLRLFLDEGVPNAVGRVFESQGHEAIYLREAILPGSPDPLVCAAAGG